MALWDQIATATKAGVGTRTTHTGQGGGGGAQNTGPKTITASGLADLGTRPGATVQNGLGGLAKKIGTGITGKGPTNSGGFAAGLVGVKPGGFAAGLVGGSAAVGARTTHPGQGGTYAGAGNLGNLWAGHQPGAQLGAAPISTAPYVPKGGGSGSQPTPGGGSADPPLTTPVGPTNAAPVGGDTGGTSISPLLILGAGALAVLFLKKRKGGLKI
jgi:hypothetical protein